MTEHPDQPQGALPSYRAYLIGSNGHIEASVHIQAANDDEAIAEAHKLNHVREVELWERGRMVAQFKPTRGE